MVSNFYSRLSADQVSSAYKLIKLLSRLRVIGRLECSTVNCVSRVETIGTYDVIDMSMNIYGIEKIAYDSAKGHQDVEELLESLFGRKSESLRGVP